MKAEVITIGDELLIGQVIDTNSSWISTELNKVGIQVMRRQTVSDDKDDIIISIEYAFASSEVVIITGGLGPTSDDKTRDTLCEFYSDKLIMNEDVLGDLTSFFRSRGKEVTERNVDQARVPSKCVAIRNPNGTAPGMWFKEGGKILVSLPGVPYEMKAMMTDFVLPELKSIFGLNSVQHRSIMTIGIGESMVADIVSDIEKSLPDDYLLAYLPSLGMVRLRLSCYTPDEKSVAILNDLVEKINHVLIKYIYALEDIALEVMVSKLLISKQFSLSVAESCTGGDIAKTFTSIPGSSDFFLGGIISYSNEIKHTQLGIDTSLIDEKGVVSEAIAIAMAEGVRERFQSDWSISTTGIAGPAGGSSEIPVGTVWLGVAGPGGSSAKKYHFSGNRERNIKLATLFAINELRLRLL